MSIAQEFLARFGYEVATRLSAIGQMRLWNVDEVSDTAVKLSGPDGMKIVLWSGAISFALEDGKEDGIKFEVSGEFPPDTFVMSEDRPKINVSYKRGAKGVGGDIERRFLKEYVPLYYKKLKLQQKIEKDRAARVRLLTDLAGAFGWKIVEDSDGLLVSAWEPGYRRSKLDAHYRIVDAYEMARPESERGWEVDLTLRKLTVDQALRIAEVLKEPRFPELVEQPRLL